MEAHTLVNSGAGNGLETIGLRIICSLALEQGLLQTLRPLCVQIDTRISKAIAQAVVKGLSGSDVPYYSIQGLYPIARFKRSDELPSGTVKQLDFSATAS